MKRHRRALDLCRNIIAQGMPAGKAEVFQGLFRRTGVRFTQEGGFSLLTTDGHRFTQIASAFAPNLCLSVSICGFRSSQPEARNPRFTDVNSLACSIFERGKALNIIPSLPFAAHRYWVGPAVLCGPTSKPETCSCPGHGND